MAYKVLPLEIVGHIFSYSEDDVPIILYPKSKAFWLARALYIVRRKNGVGLVKVVTKYVPLYFRKYSNGMTNYDLKVADCHVLCTLGANSFKICGETVDLETRNLFSMYNLGLNSFLIDTTANNALETVNQFSKLVERKNTNVVTHYYYRINSEYYLPTLRGILLQNKFPQHHKFFIASRYETGSLVNILQEANQLKDISRNAVYTVLELDAKLDLQNSEVNTKACSVDYVYLFESKIINSDAAIHIPKCEALRITDCRLILRCNFPHGKPNLVYIDTVTSFGGLLVLLEFCITEQIPNLLIGTGTWSGDINAQCHQLILQINEELEKKIPFQLHLLAVCKDGQKQKSKSHLLKPTFPKLNVRYVRTETQCFSNKVFPFFVHH